MTYDAGFVRQALELGVTSAVLAHVLEHSDCAFVRVRELLRCMGNKLVSHKLHALQKDERFLLSDASSLPTLVLNPTCGQLVLVEGNHRLYAASMEDCTEWFPVRVLVQRGAPWGGRKRGRFIGAVPEELFDFDAGKDPVRALRDMFGVDAVR